MPASESSGLPRYLRIATFIKREITKKKLVHGEKLPSLASLAEQFDVAMPTVRQAIKHLEGLGILECRHGTGTYVSGPVLQLEPFKITRKIQEWADDINMDVLESRSTRVASVPELPDDLEQAKAYQRICRRFGMDEHPFAISEVFIERQIYLDARPELSQRSAFPLRLRDLVADHDIVQHNMVIEPASNEMAKELSLTPYSPIAKSQMIMTDESNVAVYFATMIVPAETIQFEFDD